VQVQYLGYPGTMGGSFIDYLIADQVVLPPADLPFYTEAPIWMPYCYQINDSEQPIAASAPDRVACGLPEQGFVFCCFNSPYKIEPMVFDAWMQMLGGVPGSVLWLYAGNPTAVANRRQAAVDRGIAPERLVFAEMLPKDQHLARHRHADLFLDTLFYNAHTTGSDALWAGVPMLTLPGATFASRVGESLLRAVGLEEMIVPTLAAYIAQAIEFAQQPEKLAAVKQKLARHRLTCPLFDTASFTRGLEYAYQAIWQRWESGLKPEPIRVPDKI
jgi:predicted O-linked N-acetylglucosamine transferase (SPINDLY family)